MPLDIQANYPLVCQVFAFRFHKARARDGRAAKLSYEDTFQDFLLDLHRKQAEGSASKWDPARSGVSTYLYMVADGNISRSLRNSGQRGRNRFDLGDEDDVALGVTLVSEEPGPEEELARAEELAPLRAAMKLLSEEDRFVLSEIDGKGRTLVEVARDMGVTRQRVHQRLPHARARLRALLADGERAS